jgi:hypothetical protein
MSAGLFIPETRSRLQRVVVDQGDAEARHSFSFVRDQKDNRIWLNHMGFQSVKTAVQRNQADGTTDESSAYLLFSKRINATSFELSENSDQKTRFELGKSKRRITGS